MNKKILLTFIFGLPIILMGAFSVIDLGTQTSGTLAVNRGGTGGTDAANARNNLGLGTMAVETATGYVRSDGSNAAATVAFPGDLTGVNASFTGVVEAGGVDLMKNDGSNAAETVVLDTAIVAGVKHVKVAIPNYADGQQVRIRVLEANTNVTRMLNASITLAKATGILLRRHFLNKTFSFYLSASGGNHTIYDHSSSVVHESNFGETNMVIEPTPESARGYDIIIKRPTNADFFNYTSLNISFFGSSIFDTSPSITSVTVEEAP